MAKTKKSKTRVETGFQIIDERLIGEDAFFYVHDALKGYLREIGANGVALYCILASHTRIGREYLQKSMSTLAKELCLSIPTIIKYLKKLEDAGLIEIEKHPGKVSTIHLLKVEPNPQTKIN